MINLVSFFKDAQSFNVCDPTLQATLGPAKSVRMYGDSGFKRSAVTGVASDAA